MTKQEIVDQVSESTGLTKVETAVVMNGVMETIIVSLMENRKVELGVWYIRGKTSNAEKGTESKYGRFSLFTGTACTHIQTIETNAWQS